MLGQALIDSTGQARCRKCGGVRPSADPRRLRAVRSRGPRPWWWRRSPLLRISGNLLQVGSDGKLRVKSDGLVVAGASDPCCCTPAAVTCTSCAGSTPLTYLFVLSGLSLCDCATALAGNQIHGPTSYSCCLTQVTCGFHVPTKCAWQYCEMGTSTYYVDYYSSAVCAGSPFKRSDLFFVSLILSNSGSTYLVFGIESGGGTCVATAGPCTGQIGLRGEAGPEIAVFQAGFTWNSNCATSYTLANENNPCGTSSTRSTHLATGGTATLTPLGC